MNNGLSTTRAHSGSQTRTITPPVNGALSGYVCNSSCPLFKRAHAHHSPWVRSSLIRVTRDDTTRELSCHVTCVFELNHSLCHIVPFLLASFFGLGAWLVGTFLSTLLEGMLLQNTFRYFRLYSTDPIHLKIWVVFAVVMQTLTVALTMHSSYFYTVSNYLNPLVFLHGDVWSAAVVPIISSVTILTTESFFARRVYMIGRQYRIVVFVAMTMILAACGFFCAVTVQAFQLANAVSSANVGGWLPTAGSALMLAGDVQLTGVLIYALQRSRSGIRRTDSMVDILIAYAVSTGLLIVVFNVVGIALSIAYSHNIIYTASLLVAQQVYTNSFVVALNTRKFVMQRGEIGRSDLQIDVPGSGKGNASGTMVNAVELPSMAFATGPSMSQLSDVESQEYLAVTKKSEGLGTNTSTAVLSEV